MPGASAGPGLLQPYGVALRVAWNAARPVQREGVILPPAAAAPRNNLVLIVDESIRADHLSVNGYGRSTTPYLERLAQRPDLFHNWGTAVSGATCSALSNAQLITGVVPQPHADRLAAAYPTLFDYARAAGYRTAYFDAQSTTLWNGLTPADLAHVDRWITKRELGDDRDADLRAATLVHALVSASTGNFVVVNKRGVHTPYEEAYPPERGVWGPLPTSYLGQPALVANPYDNGLLYNVDTFFARLLPDPDRDLAATVVIYTSDHAQTLFEHGESWSHCNGTRSEASVPLIVLGRLAGAPNTHLAARHANILPTFLDLMAVPDAARAHPYAASLLAPAGRGNGRMGEGGNGGEAPRAFLDGAGELVTYDER